MAVSGDVTVTENGGQRSAKLHPYLITLVRWCISCLWGTASLFLHRLTAPLPAITASKQTKPPAKPRQAGTDHLHPDPRVECVVLHEPPSQPPTLDVIFVHGLYGSLCNTWRQGDWRSKYKLDPTKVPLRNHTTNTCTCDNQMKYIYNDLNEIYTYETSLNENITFNNINEKLRKILPNENSLITEKFYNNTLEIVDNYDTQARFVEELFKNENKHCDNSCNSNKEIDGYRLKNDSKTVNGFKCNLDSVNSFKCNLDNVNGGKCNLDSVNQCKCLNGCNVGCGCVCDDCYSSCWPRDWIKEDFPGARVISINYTSDPYLWRPLWVKENKRLRLHERAEQMMQQLLSLDVGKIPIIWVGHSKGGLFIKQIYCEAYEAFLATKKHTNKEDIEISINKDSKDNNLNEMINDKYEVECESNILNNETVYSSVNLSNNNMNCAKNSTTSNNNDNINGIKRNIDISNNYRIHCDENYEINKDGNSNFNTKHMKGNDEVLLKDVNNDMIISLSNDEPWITNEMNDSTSDNELNDSNESSEYKEDAQHLKTRSSLWTQSAGFMFYSVPHRGSPLADIKTPITARSIELLEIAKECPLVMELQDRWLAATGASRPQVRSLVETYRTLMSVLWLRIVSVDSADAGVGSLHGVSVDHREICKPASRDCLLYQELKELIQRSLKKCDC